MYALGVTLSAAVDGTAGRGPSMFTDFADVPPDVIDKDLRSLLTDSSIAALVDDGLFAFGFNEEKGMVDAGPATVDFVKDVVRRTGR